MPCCVGAWEGAGLGLCFCSCWVPTMPHMVAMAVSCCVWAWERLHTRSLLHQLTAQLAPMLASPRGGATLKTEKKFKPWCTLLLWAGLWLQQSPFVENADEPWQWIWPQGGSGPPAAHPWLACKTQLSLMIHLASHRFLGAMPGPCPGPCLWILA